MHVICTYEKIDPTLQKFNYMQNYICSMESVRSESPTFEMFHQTFHTLGMNEQVHKIPVSNYNSRYQHKETE